MSVHRYFCVIVGSWKLQNWRLYRLREHVDAKTGGEKVRRKDWDRVSWRKPA